MANRLRFDVYGYGFLLFCIVFFFSSFCLANDNATAVFSVTDFSIEGENPISSEQTKAVLEPFIGEHEGLEGLLEAAAELEAAILSAGYSFNRVTLPPQTLDNGAVILKISQIKLANVEVEGNEHFTDENIMNSLPEFEIGTVPSTERLSRQLIVVNNHSSKQVKIRLKQGQEANTVDAVLDVTDQKPWRIFAALNNIGTKETGRMRATVGGQHSNLLGFDDSLTLSYTTSPNHTGDVKQWGISYSIPVYKYFGNLNLYYSRSDVDSGTIQNVFDVSGAGKFIGASYTYTLPNLQNYRHRARIGIDDKLFKNNILFGGARLTGGGIGAVDVRSRPLSLSYFGEFRMEKSQFGFDVSYVRNMDGGSHNKESTYGASRIGAEQNWDVFRYSARYNHSLTQHWLLRLSWHGQYSNEPLISGEQFGIGGVSSVRGFEERGATGDKGNQATIEFSRPVNEYARVRFFSDIGHVDRLRPQPGEIKSQTLFSAGLGMSFYWKGLNFSIDYAHELNDGRSDNIGGTKTHASLFYQF